LWIWIALGVSVWLSLRRERGGATNWHRPAWIGFTAVCAYIFVNGLITGAAGRMASSALDAGGRKDALVVASPPPLAFWKRDIFWRTADRYGTASFVPGVGGNVDLTGSPTGVADPRIETWAKADPAARAFLF